MPIEEGKRSSGNGKNGFVRKEGEDFSERDYVFVSEKRSEDGMKGWDGMG